MTTLPTQRLIVEGVELAGKSYLINELYTFLEPQKSSDKQHLLDGCHWFNCDVGVFGTKHGRMILDHYTSMAKHLDDAHVIFEKFHISDQVYNKIYNNLEVDYTELEAALLQQNFKIIFLHVDENISLFEHRLNDRLSLYPHYKRIAQKPKDYIAQQQTYQHILSSTKLPALSINTSQLPQPQLLTTITTWLNNQQSYM